MHHVVVVTEFTEGFVDEISMVPVNFARPLRSAFEILTK